MARPVAPKPASEQIGVLSRMLRQVSVDDSINPRRKQRLGKLIGDLMAEFQKEVAGAASPLSRAVPTAPRRVAGVK